MKFSTIPVVLAAAAGLVSSAPIVIVYASKPRVPVPDAAPAWAQSLRWGHAAAPAFNLPALEPIRPQHSPDGWHPIPSSPSPTLDPEWARLTEKLNSMLHEPPVPKRKGGCRMKKMHGGKSLQWGNKLREILGLPPIETFHSWTPKFITETLINGNGTVVYEKKIPVRLPTHHRHHMRPLHPRPPFMFRLSQALASLGPWEGRAVSFVLGCGLGVLLRMLFVFGVLIVRSVRARREERRVTLEEDTVIFVTDVKEPVIVEALPAYAEKVEAEVEEAPQTNNAH